MSEPRRVVLLGATGSIGRSAIDVVERRPRDLRVVGLSARSDAAGVCALAERLGVERVALADPRAAEEARRRLGPGGPEVLGGEEASAALASGPDVDVVLNGIVGAQGLAPTLAALDAGIDVALANKESLVIGGERVREALGTGGAALVPVDSEHASLRACLQGRSPASVKRMVLTASGGPFRTTPRDALFDLPPDQALRHPTWEMGARITIDSATLMNKGFEVIEARWLFDIEPDRIDVVVHPQSIVHAMIELGDGTVLAHLAPPDMRIPIAAALLDPEGPPLRFESLDLARMGTLEFEPPDRERFPCLALAESALRAGGTMPAVLNAADEIAVGAYLERRIPFGRIPTVIEDVLAEHRVGSAADVSSIFAADAWARQEAERVISRAGEARSPRPVARRGRTPDERTSSP